MSRVLPADREVQLFEAGCLGLDASEARAGADQRVDEVGHVGLVRELDGGHAVAVVRAHVGEILRGVEQRGIVGVEHDACRGPVLARELAGRARHHRLTVVHHDHLVGEALGLEQEVRAHEDGLAALGHLVDEAEHRAGRLGVEARGRLVEQEEVGLVEHRPGQREAGAHAGGVPADLQVEGVGDAEALRRLGDALVDQAGLHPEQRRRVLEVVGAGETVVERGAGRDDAAATAHLGALGVDLGIEPERAHRAAVGVQRPGHEPHHGGLARAVGTEQHGHGAPGHLEGQVVDRERRRRTSDGRL